MSNLDSIISCLDCRETNMALMDKTLEEANLDRLLSQGEGWLCFELGNLQHFLSSRWYHGTCHSSEVKGIIQCCPQHWLEKAWWTPLCQDLWPKKGPSCCSCQPMSGQQDCRICQTWPGMEHSTSQLVSPWEEDTGDRVELDHDVDFDGDGSDSNATLSSNKNVKPRNPSNRPKIRICNKFWIN